MDSVSLKDNDADKDESVYLISDANGNVNKTIVVDHLKNKDKRIHWRMLQTFQISRT